MKQRVSPERSGEKKINRISSFTFQLLEQSLLKKLSSLTIFPNYRHNSPIHIFTLIWHCRNIKAAVISFSITFAKILQTPLQMDIHSLFLNSVLMSVRLQVLLVKRKGVCTNLYFKINTWNRRKKKTTYYKKIRAKFQCIMLGWVLLFSFAKAEILLFDQPQK